MENNKRSWQAALLVLAVFVLGVLLGGFGSHLWGERVWGHPGPLSHRDQIIANLTNSLDLTADQQKQVTAIVDQTQSQIRALYAPLDPERDQIRQQSRQQIRQILTAEQKPKFDQFLQRLDEQRKNEGQR
jgi:Spy/CpxP family protein refolding chaperone